MQLIIIIVVVSLIYFCFLSMELAKLLVKFGKRNKQLEQQSSEKKTTSINELFVKKEIIDHSFAKRVSNEIIKNNSTLSRMDETIKGHKNLKRSMQKLEQTLKSSGYELIDMLNKPYNEGMNLIPTFLPDDSLSDGEQIIKSIIKPQINYKGIMIQSAEVIVNQG